jgi:histidinol-phosphate aminotransferase
MDEKIRISKPIYLDHSSLKYPLPEKLLFELSNELPNINKYPSGGNYLKLSAKLAGYVDVAPENILPVNGSDEVIEAATRAFGSKLILIPIPTFSQYEASADRNRFNKKLVNCLQGYDYKLNYSDDDLKKASLVWICNPNNPTGDSISRENIKNILDRSAGIVVVDECNYEYLGETAVDLINKYRNLVISRSFSKNFGLAGLRLGFTIASPENIMKIARYCQHFRVNRMAEIAGIKVLKYLNYYKGIWQEVAKVRKQFIAALQQINIMAFPSKSNFVLVDFITRENTKSVWQYLRKEGVYAFAAWEDEFSGLENHYIRFTIGTRQEMDYTLMLLNQYQTNNPN